MLSPEFGGFLSGGNEQAPLLLLTQCEAAKPEPVDDCGNFLPMVEVAGNPSLIGTSAEEMVAQRDLLHTFEMLAGHCYKFHESKGIIQVYNSNGSYAYKKIDITPEMVNIWGGVLIGMLADFSEYPSSAAEAKRILAKLDEPRQKEMVNLNKMWDTGTEERDEELRNLHTRWDTKTEGDEDGWTRGWNGGPLIILRGTYQTHS